MSPFIQFFFLALSWYQLPCVTHGSHARVFVCAAAQPSSHVGYTLRGPTLDGFRNGLVNEGCSGLVVLSSTSPSNLGNDTGVDGSVIDRCSVLIRRPGQPSSADLLNCDEQGVK